MKALTAGILVALTIVLGVIAYDLHRVANVMSGVTGIGDTSKPETIAEHDARLRAQMRLLDHDADIILGFPKNDAHHTATPKSK